MLKFLLLISACSACLCVCPIQALLWLILSFVLGSMLMIYLGAEFMAMLLILVYVGAIAVLFLFVVMLLNMRKVELGNLLVDYFPLGLMIGFILVVFLLYGIFFNMSENFIFDEYLSWIGYMSVLPEIENFGYIFFDLYYYYFMMLGFLLLAVLVGVVVLMN